MYIYEGMIDMGLLESQKWPSKAHRVVASNIALCNSRVTTRDSLTEIVQRVIAIPNDKIKKVTVTDLAKDWHVPFINLS